MKNLYTSLLLCASALLFSCKPVNTEPQPVPEPDPQPETRTLTFNLPAVGEDAPAAVKTSWQAGDQILVHGEYSKDQVVVTLSAGDISSDGKSATKTVDGLYPYVREDCTSTLYASYPASAADNLKHCFFYSKFSTTNEDILAACNSGDKFDFQRICGSFSFSVDPSFESFVLTGARKEVLGYDFLQVKLTDKEQNFNQYYGSPVISLEGKLTDGVAMLYMPDGISVGSCVIKLMKEGKAVAICKGGDGFAISRGQLSDLGDISEKVIPYDDPFSGDVKDLDAEGNANCYIVTEPGIYKFKAVRGNSRTDYLVDVADAAIVWESWNNAEEVETNSVVKSVSFAEDYMILHTPDQLKAGNALIAAVDVEGKILWSWHIWVPATEIQTSTFGGLYGDLPLMDRNLGALVAAKVGEPVTAESYGFTYQWGRKDPFTGPSAVVSGDCSPATISGVQAEVAPGLISLEQSIANPTLLGHQDNGDWLNLFDNNLWIDDSKTIYDPCPVGYRVPAYDASMPLFTLTAAPGWSVDMTNGYITMGNPATVFPIGGYRDDYGVGSLAKVGKRVAIWTARYNGDITGTHMNLRPDGGTFAVGGTGKSRGCYVRCVKEN